MTERRFAADVATLAAARLLSMAAGFGVSVLGARVLGPAALGAVGAAQTIGLAAAVVANGGLNIVTIYLLGARPADRGVVMATLRPFVVVAAVSAGGAALLAAVLTQQALGLSGRTALFVVASLLATALITYEFWSSVLLGIGRSMSYTAAELIRALSTLAATALLLAGIWRDEVGYLAAAASAYAAAALYARWMGSRDLPAEGGRFDGALLGESLRMGLRGQVGNVLQFLNLRLDLLLVPALLDLATAGVYVVAVRVSEVVAQAASAGGSLIFPQVATAGGDARATALTEITARRSLLLVGGAGVAMAILAEPILAIFGPAYRGGVDTVRVLLLAMLPLTLTRVLAGDLKGRGRPGVVSLATGLAVGATAALDLLLIPMLGIMGAAVASLVAYGLSALGLVVVFARVAKSHPLRLVPRWSDAIGIADWLRGRR